MDMDEIVEIVARSLYDDFRIEKEMTGPGCTSFEDHTRLHPELNEPYWEAAQVIISALSARGLAVVKGWQPFETAPKGNGAFLVWLEDEGFATLGRWRKWSADGKSGEDVYLSSMDAYADEHTPTHWMPLPARPSLKEGT